MVLVHLQEPLHFLLNHFGNVFGHDFALQVFQNLLDGLLLFIFFIREVLLERVVNLFQLFLGLGLVLFEVVLLLELGPQFDLVHEVSKNVGCQLQALAYSFSLVGLLQIMFVLLDEESVRINILRQADTSQELVNEPVGVWRLEVAIQQLEVSDELLFRGQSKALFPLFLDERSEHLFWGVKVVFADLCGAVGLVNENASERLHWVEPGVELAPLHGQYVEQVGTEWVVRVVDGLGVAQGSHAVDVALLSDLGEAQPLGQTHSCFVLELGAEVALGRGQDLVVFDHRGEDRILLLDYLVLLLSDAE